ncbi:g1605 [Coccomyxa viridis]|uniref:G1605 protein n=1 Tax=Coccomyxa viridis TaxID=1274662 RepID=A0ABP1FID1_9CHLO
MSQIMPVLPCHICSLIDSSKALPGVARRLKPAHALGSLRQGCSDHSTSHHSSSVLHQPRRHRAWTLVRASDRDEDDELLIEEELRSKRRKKKSNVNVVAPQVQQAYGLEPQTAEGQIETSYLLFLGLVFVFIILEGLFIATSGFLPEAADQFAQDVVYPSFSPTVGFFLLLSTAYGIWKSRQS